MIPSLLTPKGYRRYSEVVDGIPGLVACWPLNELSGATSVDRIGGYNGTNSGATYYNQVTVSGTLNPDATGVYTAAGMYNNYPYYRRGSDNYFLWWYTALNGYRLTTTLGTSTPNRWVSALGSDPVAEDYSPVPPATGTATVANVTESGVYAWLPSGLTYANAGPLVNGEVVRAMGFDGASGKINCGDLTILDGASSASCSAWIKPNAVATLNQKICVKLGSSGDRSFQFCFSDQSAGELVIDIWQGEDRYINYTSNATIGNGTWVHIAWVWYGVRNVVVYKNGIPLTMGDQGSASLTTITNSSVPIFIGCNGAGTGNFFSGSLADLRLYNRALTATEVAQLYYGAVIGV